MVGSTYLCCSVITELLFRRERPQSPDDQWVLTVCSWQKCPCFCSLVTGVELREIQTWERKLVLPLGTTGKAPDRWLFPVLPVLPTWCCSSDACSIHCRNELSWLPSGSNLVLGNAGLGYVSSSEPEIPYDLVFLFVLVTPVCWLPSQVFRVVLWWPFILFSESVVERNRERCV